MISFDLSDYSGILGEWFLPKKQDTLIQGVLSQNDKGKLEMHSLYHFDDSHIILEGKNYEVINGMLSTGPRVSLINSFMTTTMHAPGYDEAIFDPRAVVIGCHIQEWDFRIDAISAEFDRVDDWLGVHPFSYTFPKDGSQMTISSKLPFLPQFEVDDKAIVIICSHGTRNRNSKEVSLRYGVRVEIQFKAQKKLTEAMDELQTLSDFFTLCMGTKCNFRDIRFTYNSSDSNVLLFNRPSEEKTTKRNLPPFLIPYQSIHEQFALCLGAWYDKKESIAPVIDYFVEANDVHQQQSVIMSFLKLAQALESFSRITWKCSAEPQEHYEERVNRILDALSANSEDQEWIEKMLKRPGANEPSNNKRFKDILRRVKDILKITGKDAVKSFARRIVVTRNYYTHFNEDIKKDIYSNQELYFANVLLKEALRILLLRELGVAEEAIISGSQNAQDVYRACCQLKLN